MNAEDIQYRSKDTNSGWRDCGCGARNRRVLREIAVDNSIVATLVAWDDGIEVVWAWLGEVLQGR